MSYFKALIFVVLFFWQVVDSSITVTRLISGDRFTSESCLKQCHRIGLNGTITAQCNEWTQGWNSCCLGCNCEFGITYSSTKKGCVPNQDLYGDCYYRFESKQYPTAPVPYQNFAQSATLTTLAYVDVYEQNPLQNCRIDYDRSFYEERGQWKPLFNDGVRDFSLQFTGFAYELKWDTSTAGSRYPGYLMKIGIDCTVTNELPGKSCILLKSAGVFTEPSLIPTTSTAPPSSTEKAGDGTQTTPKGTSGPISPPTSIPTTTSSNTTNGTIPVPHATKEFWETTTGIIVLVLCGILVGISLLLLIILCGCRYRRSKTLMIERSTSKAPFVGGMVNHDAIVSVAMEEHDGTSDYSSDEFSSDSSFDDDHHQVKENPYETIAEARKSMKTGDIRIISSPQLFFGEPSVVSIGNSLTRPSSVSHLPLTFVPREPQRRRRSRRSSAKSNTLPHTLREPKPPVFAMDELFPPPPPEVVLASSVIVSQPLRKDSSAPDLIHLAPRRPRRNSVDDIVPMTDASSQHSNDLIYDHPESDSSFCPSQKDSGRFSPNDGSDRPMDSDSDFDSVSSMDSESNAEDCDRHVVQIHHNEHRDEGIYDRPEIDESSGRVNQNHTEQEHYDQPECIHSDVPSPIANVNNEGPSRQVLRKRLEDLFNLKSTTAYDLEQANNVTESTPVPSTYRQVSNDETISHGKKLKPLPRSISEGGTLRTLPKPPVPAKSEKAKAATLRSKDSKRLSVLRTGSINL